MNRLPSDWIIYVLIAPLAPAMIVGWFIGQCLGRACRDLP
jgi:hypothetical protein